MLLKATTFPLPQNVFPYSWREIITPPPPIFRMEEGLTPFVAALLTLQIGVTKATPPFPFPTHIHPATPNKTFPRDVNSTSISTQFQGVLISPAVVTRHRFERRNFRNFEILI